MAWANRKSITFKFKDLGLLLAAEMGKNKEIHIENETPMQQDGSTRIKTLILSDNSKKE